MAALGVGARRSATKSEISTSTSCPTAETTGVCMKKIASATASSLNAHRSSTLPPPLPTITTSADKLSAYFRLLAICDAAASPCTKSIDDHYFQQWPAFLYDLKHIVKCRTLFGCDKHKLFYMFGNGFFLLCIKIAFGFKPFFQLFKCQSQCSLPIRFYFYSIELILSSWRIDTYGTFYDNMHPFFYT